MRRFLSAVMLILCLLLSTGCGERTAVSASAKLTAEDALQELEAHLLDTGLVSQGLTGSAGESLEWDKALVQLDAGCDMVTDDPAVTETEIDGRPCWQAYLRYGADTGAPMAGRRYGDYAIAKDGSTCWAWNIAASQWDPI